eukprot:gnl/MRDRNA2_/MRDRNA2_66673_c0_seq1.p1 gnl/MRDRNA2_/MRDRNA2_66673_c0~~gnl/MRDRNA2_/MRDRNA2_66673_c0_seq1.p1  ORF type:complete len:100 (+),score=5.47 gnl/MRDRNA2_/MRDRNA2_66673_c0_seq1:32-301(+)
MAEEVDVTVVCDEPKLDHVCNGPLHDIGLLGTEGDNCHAITCKTQLQMLYAERELCCWQVDQSCYYFKGKPNITMRDDGTVSNHINRSK